MFKKKSVKEDFQKWLDKQGAVPRYIYDELAALYAVGKERNAALIQECRRQKQEAAEWEKKYHAVRKIASDLKARQEKILGLTSDASKLLNLVEYQENVISRLMEDSTSTAIKANEDRETFRKFCKNVAECPSKNEVRLKFQHHKPMTDLLLEEDAEYMLWIPNRSQPFFEDTYARENVLFSFDESENIYGTQDDFWFAEIPEAEEVEMVEE